MKRRKCFSLSVCLSLTFLLHSSSKICRKKSDGWMKSGWSQSVLIQTGYRSLLNSLWFRYFPTNDDFIKISTNLIPHGFFINLFMSRFHCRVPINASIYIRIYLLNIVGICVSGQLWVSVGGGKVMVFDASSWSLIQTCQVGNARLVRDATWNLKAVIFYIGYHLQSLIPLKKIIFKVISATKTQESFAYKEFRCKDHLKTKE